MALSDFNMTENEAEYLLGSLLHCYILEILAYGIYTVMYFVALYLTRKFFNSILLSAFIDVVQ